MDNKPYILSVDDEEMNQEIVMDLLEDDFHIKSVFTGKECIESLSEQRPDIILLDVNMPVMNGLETCKRIRDDAEFKDIPILFVSALASAKEIQHGLDIGADGYITKPFDDVKLKEEIMSLIGEKNA
ncbi:MAG: response regulator [Sulfuriflexus sp.]|nr:response regulator [Sulfuriflexus sp.]